MKILGHSGLKPRTEKVRIGHSQDDGSDLTLTLTAPRLNTITKLEADLEPPPPPIEPAAPATGEVERDKHGRVIKDDEGRPLTTRNYSDPAYLEALKAHGKAMEEYEEVQKRHNRAKTMGMLLECLGDQIQLEAKREDYTDGNGGPGKKGELVDFFDAAFEEFEASGIDLLVLGRLSDATLRLVGVEDEEIDNAKEALGASGN